VGGCSRASASPHVDGSLAQAICRGDPARSASQECCSSSPTACGSFALPLELGRPARTQCLVGTTPTAHHGGFRSRIPRQQLTKEEPANTRAFSMMHALPSELIMRAERPCLLSASCSNHPLSLYCSLASSSLRIPWAEPSYASEKSLLAHPFKLNVLANLWILRNLDTGGEPFCLRCEERQGLLQ
jgi:hypothetical protein